MNQAVYLLDDYTECTAALCHAISSRKVVNVIETAFISRLVPLTSFRRLCMKYAAWNKAGQVIVATITAEELVVLLQ